MNVLLVGAHWDDIELGCALTAMRLKNRGANLYGVVLTESDYRIEEVGHEREAGRARDEGLAAFEKIGIIHKPTRPLPNQRMIYDQEAMQELEGIANDCSIDVVFTHWFGDYNTDHIATWDISRLAFRRVRNVMMYQSNAYFDNIKVFTPQFFWGFSDEEYEHKKGLIALHETEWKYRRERWEREVFDRERFWGYLCGCDYAEAFMVVRLLDTHAIGLTTTGDG